MKRKVIAILILVILFMFGGCGVRDNTHTTELYKIYVFKDTATILELTEKGKEQEVLIIPSEFKGNPVKQIGKVLYFGSEARFIKPAQQTTFSMNYMRQCHGLIFLGLDRLLDLLKKRA